MLSETAQAVIFAAQNDFHEALIDLKECHGLTVETAFLKVYENKLGALDSCPTCKWPTYLGTFKEDGETLDCKHCSNPNCLWWGNKE